MYDSTKKLLNNVPEEMQGKKATAFWCLCWYLAYQSPSHFQFRGCRISWANWKWYVYFYWRNWRMMKLKSLVIWLKILMLRVRSRMRLQSKSQNPTEPHLGELLSRDHLFKTSDNTPILLAEQKSTFHTITTTVLYLSQQGRPGIQLAAASFAHE